MRIRTLVVAPLALTLVSCATQRPINRDELDSIPPTLGERSSLPERSPLSKARAVLFPTETERAFEQERRADLVVFYEGADAMRIVSVSGKDVKDDDVSPADWPGFMDQQRKKSLVVVIIAKQTWPKEELARHLAHVNDYFLSHGYRRVIIQQARARGRPILSDTARPGSSRPRFQRRWDGAG